MSVAYILYRGTADGFQFSCSTPPFHNVQYAAQSVFPICEIARAILGLETPVLDVIKTPKFRALLQHIGRFSLLTSTGVYLIPMNLPESFPYESVETELPYEDMRRVWPVAHEQQLDLRSVPANFGTVIPGAKFALLDFMDSTYWPGLSEALYIGSFRRSDGPWSTYLATAGEFPSEEETRELKGVVLSGALHSAYQDLPWRPSAEDWIRRAAAPQETVKLLGLCFGCQLAAQALGGRVTPNPIHRFIYKPEKIDFAAGYLSQRMGTDSTELAECHNDSVVTLPPGTELWGASLSTGIEIWGIPGKAMFTQGHPEFPKDFMVHFLLPAFHVEGDLSAVQAEEAVQLYQEKPDIGEKLLKVMQDWLRE